VLIVLADQATNTISKALVQIHTVYSQFDHNNASSNISLQERDHPDQDFYQNPSWTHSMIYIMVAHAIGITTTILVFSGSFDLDLVTLLIPSESLLSYPPIYTALTIWLFIMLSMLLEDISYAQGNALRSVIGVTRQTFVQCCRIYLFSNSLTGGILIMFNDVYGMMALLLFCASAAMYCVLSATVYFITVRHRNVFL
jgi:hypothetical protein